MRKSLLVLSLMLISVSALAEDKPLATYSELQSFCYDENGKFLKSDICLRSKEYWDKETSEYERILNKIGTSEKLTSEEEKKLEKAAKDYF